MIIVDECNEFKLYANDENNQNFTKNWYLDLLLQ